MKLSSRIVKFSGYPQTTINNDPKNVVSLTIADEVPQPGPEVLGLQIVEPFHLPIIDRIRITGDGLQLVLIRPPSNTNSDNGHLPFGE